MNFRSTIFLSGILLITYSSFSQNSPVKSLILKQEPTSISKDSSGFTNFYSISFEAKDGIILTSVDFALKGQATDSVICQKNFSLPQVDGVYQANNINYALIKDVNNVYIILGNIKSSEPLKLVAGFKDVNNNHYSGILTNQ